MLGVDEGESLGREEGRGGGVSELGNGVKVLRARCGGGGCAGVVVGPEENIIRSSGTPEREKQRTETKQETFCLCLCTLFVGLLKENES